MFQISDLEFEFCLTFFRQLIEGVQLPGLGPDLIVRNVGARSLALRRVILKKLLCFTTSSQTFTLSSYLHL
jgi:hypothetical protein